MKSTPQNVSIAEPAHTFVPSAHRNPLKIIDFYKMCGKIKIETEAVLLWHIIFQANALNAENAKKNVRKVQFIQAAGSML